MNFEIIYYWTPLKEYLKDSNTYLLHNYTIVFALHLVRVGKMFFRT